MYEHPFTIKEVAWLLSIRCLEGGSDQEFRVECPYCGDTRGKCSFCISKNGEIKNVFHCFHCGQGGNMLGDAMFYGSGAGKLPTASAVAADVVEAAKHLHDTIPNNWSNEEMTLMEPDSVEGRFFVRVKDTSLDEVDKAFGKVEAVIEPDSLPEEFGFITRLMTQGEYKERVKALGENVLGMIRVKD